MKIPTANRPLKSVPGFSLPVSAKRVEASGFSTSSLQLSTARARAFTLIEIAICLAIIGIALVGIIGVLPIGLNTQRDTREETVINQDAAVLLPIITQGVRGADDLTNYVYAIVNVGTNITPVGYYNPNPNFSSLVTLTKSTYPSILPVNWSASLTNGANIVGLLSTPEYTSNGITQPFYSTGDISNHILANVVSMSGPAAEKPPQNNGIVVGDSFSYRLLVVNAPVAQDTNNFSSGSVQQYALQLAATQHEFRMTFYWPLLPNGRVGNTSLTYRTTVAGQLATNGFLVNNIQPLYFYQPQSFALNTNSYSN